MSSFDVVLNVGHDVAFEARIDVFPVRFIVFSAELIVFLGMSQGAKVLASLQGLTL